MQLHLHSLKPRNPFLWKVGFPRSGVESDPLSYNRATSSPGEEKLNSACTFGHICYWGFWLYILWGFMRFHPSKCHILPFIVPSYVVCCGYFSYFNLLYIPLLQGPDSVGGLWNGFFPFCLLLGLVWRRIWGKFTFLQLSKSTACSLWNIIPSIAAFISNSCAQDVFIHSDDESAIFTIPYQQIGAEVVQSSSTRGNCKLPSLRVISARQNNEDKIRNKMLNCENPCQ